MGEMQLTLQCPANSVLLTNHLGLTFEVLELSELSYERILNRNLEGRKEGQVKSQNNIANSDDENLCPTKSQRAVILRLLFTFDSKEDRHPSFPR